MKGTFNFIIYHMARTSDPDLAWLTEAQQRALDGVSIRDVVDLEKYPIFDLDSDKAQQAIAACRAQLHEAGSAIVPNFIRADLVAKMAAEVSELPAWNRKWEISAFAGSTPPPGAGPEHPMNVMWEQNIHAVANDCIPMDCLVKKVYHSPEVKAFLARAIQKPALYEYADEFQSLNIMYTYDGGKRAWHYDGSDVVITLMLQKSEQGGWFQFAPFIRGQGPIDEDQVCASEPWDRVSALFDASEGLESAGATFPGVITTPGAKAGDLVIFNGQRSLHRVTAVKGPVKRILAVLSYDSRPPAAQTVGHEELNVRLYGERVQKIYDERNAAAPRAKM